MNIINNRGPRIDFWKTPILIILGLDWYPLRSTIYCLFVINDSIQPIDKFEKFRVYNLDNNKLWLIVSNV